MTYRPGPPAAAAPAPAPGAPAAPAPGAPPAAPPAPGAPPVVPTPPGPGAPPTAPIPAAPAAPTPPAAPAHNNQNWFQRVLGDILSFMTIPIVVITMFFFWITRNNKDHQLVVISVAVGLALGYLFWSWIKYRAERHEMEHPPAPPAPAPAPAPPAPPAPAGPVYPVNPPPGTPAFDWTDPTTGCIYHWDTSRWWLWDPAAGTWV